MVKKKKNKVTTNVLASGRNILLGPSLPLDSVQGRPTLKSLFSTLMPDLALRKHTHTHRKEKGRVREMKRRRNHRAPSKH